MNELTDLIHAVCVYYRNSPSAPSVILSYLDNKACFYGSICRYEERGGRGRVVVARAEGDTLELIIRQLAAQFTAIRGGFQVTSVTHTPDMPEQTE